MNKRAKKIIKKKSKIFQTEKKIEQENFKLKEFLLLIYFIFIKKVSQKNFNEK